MPTHLSSASAERLLQLLAGVPDPDGDSKYSAIPKAMGPTIELIQDVVADVEDVAELLDDATAVGRRRSQFLRRRKRPGLSREGDDILFNGRRCCGKLVQEINAALHVIAIPSEFGCTTCGAVYRVAWMPREERRHG